MANKNEGHLNREIAPAATQGTRQAVRAAMQEAEKTERDAETKPEETKPAYNPFFNYHKPRFPIWQRLIVLISLAAIALVAGAMFGYGVLGHANPWAVFYPGTWQHILDFLKTK
ncbi:DNA-directed RNA polymerase subunit beta [Sporolactobacillus putidus]|uniref:DNA-directed RNA polymerase subunit beta n=1 Tax=Sporolactobacillus putidus TaxID=492735 RepID=A0A917S1G7_9BACL|nr:DNA-directed RNA polymerase subunit beta [Sporolactobacillus putidus]GGL50521.1 hypothetical protein GCM10007968_13410 [Sporolactobacillus putidus]